MINTVTVERPIRQKLRLACLIMFIISACFIAMLVCTAQIGKLNLNGQVSEVTGTLTELFKDDSSNTVTLDKDKHCNIVFDRKKIDFKQYLNKEITLVVTQKTFGNSNPWAMGLVADGQTVVDYKDTLKTKAAENDELKKISIALTVVTCVATCALFIWRFNIPVTQERKLYHAFADFVCQRQPPCPERKKATYFAFAYIIAIFVLEIPTIVVNGMADNMPQLTTAGIVLGIIMAVVAVLGAITLFSLILWANRKEKEFYAQKLPFDFADISHIAMRKKYKEEFQQQVIKAYAENPDLYPDGGNGYDVLFKEGGVEVKSSFETDNESTTDMPQAEEVFGTAEQKPDEGKTVMTFTYEQLNLEAVAHYRRSTRPMTIIVKSRLTRDGSFPDEFVNDLHLVLDSHLLGTLKKFDVKVENLDYLLENKAQLMKENCNKRKKEREAF